MTIKIGAAYIRASTDDQLEYSPDSQLKTVRDYAKRDGYIIPDEFVFQDDAISGKLADRRPSFRLMIAQAKEQPPPFDCIYVWEFSRFARNREESVVYKNLLRKNGVSVRSVREPLPDGPFAGLIESIIEWMDEYYLINLSIEVRRGMKEKASRGEAMGTAPFGYTVKDKSFIPNENAEIIRYIFSAYASGKGMRKIAAELGERGVRTRRGNLPDNRWVQYILGNPVYIGKIRWSTEGHANYSRANYDGENVMVSDGHHEPLIEMPLWETVQQKLKERDTEVKYRRKENPRDYMLKGILRCGDCGSTLTYVSTATPSLQCHKYARGQCGTSHSITLAKSEAAVIKALEELAESRAFRFVPMTEKVKAPSRDWDKLISSERSRLARARSALLDGVFSNQEYAEVKAEVEDAIARMKAAQAESDAVSSAPPDPELFRLRVLDVLETIKSPDASPEYKNQSLRSIIDKILYQKPGNTLEIFFVPAL